MIIVFFVTLLAVFGFICLLFPKKVAYFGEKRVKPLGYFPGKLLNHLLGIQDKEEDNNNYVPKKTELFLIRINGIVLLVVAVGMIIMMVSLNII